jgi:hypothetical protein
VEALWELPSRHKLPGLGAQVRYESHSQLPAVGEAAAPTVVDDEFIEAVAGRSTGELAS